MKAMPIFFRDRIIWGNRIETYWMTINQDKSSECIVIGMQKKIKKCFHTWATKNTGPWALFGK